ncbi:M48 family metallopeptidase [Ammoniphilus resinae]|uniref:Zn-dependent protease with chaperone function n=1 Tax=Ammoniphilus resinae TaxID=861532 RepID=A0ABS4GJ54_9BACL|nr:M48 family metallopeptidase [Ammoniphilus resinae]MBP1930285.1 Zn-dependent protease with chaperone function [Ammoniphilus resinae]
MRKFYLIFTALFIIYSVAIGIYLLTTPSSLPPDLKGSPADPTTFMSPEQVEQAYAFSRIKNILFFIGGPLEWAIYLLILGLGLSAKFRDVVESVIKGSFWRVALFVLLLTFTTTLLQFPLDYYAFHLKHVYGISNETFNSWMTDNIKGFWVSAVLTIPIVWLLYLVIRKSPKRWWLWCWLGSIPLSLFFMFIQPVVLDPIYHKFTPLQDQQLKKEILDLAAEAHIPTEKVYQVDMSRKTNALNAYVNGIGSNTRIVLWDTTLQKLKKDEILFIMAHEMGHYTLHHMAWLFLGSIFMVLAALLVVYYLLRWTVRSCGKYWGIHQVTDLASLPVILLILSVLSFITMPIQNTVSRQYEHAADVYAMQLRNDPDVAIRTFQKLAVEGLSEVNPPALVKYALYGHPTLHERILYVKNYSK